MVPLVEVVLEPGSRACPPLQHQLLGRELNGREA
jgi:hypothetical protein